MPIDRDQAQKLLDQVIAEGRRLAADAEIQASLRSVRDANTRFARNEITSTGDVEETVLAVEAGFGKRRAATRTNQTDPDSVRAALARAVRLARLAPEDPETMPVLAGQRYAAVPGSFDPASAGLTAAARAEAAEQAIAEAEKKKLVIAGFYEHEAVATAIASSAGLFAYHSETGARFTCTARTEDGAGSGWAGAASHRAADLDVGRVVGTATDKALRSVKPSRLEPGRTTVVLEPRAVADLLQSLVMSLDARRADESRSFFARPGGGNRVGESLFPAGVTLRSDPADPLAPAPPFAGDGLPRGAVTWIEKGRLQALSYSRFWAAKQGKAPVQVSNTLLSGGEASTEDLIRGVEKGVLITRFWYIRSLDPQTILMTGLTRDGVFRIERGEIAGPVNNFRFNESPVTMLKNAEAIGREMVRVPGGRTRVPALRTREFNLASISDAV
jgi:predicted Zn-dependent protease